MGLYSVLNKKGIIKGENVETINCVKTTVFAEQRAMRIMTRDGLKIITVPVMDNKNLTKG